MHQVYTDSSQVDCLPSQNSFDNYFSKTQTVIKENRTQINTRLAKTLTDYQVIVMGDIVQLAKIKQQQGYSAASIIKAIESLDPNETEWAETNSLVTNFVEAVKNKITYALDQMKLDTIQQIEKLSEVIKQI